MLPWFFAADHLTQSGTNVAAIGDGAFSAGSGSGTSITLDGTLGRRVFQSTSSTFEKTFLARNRLTVGTRGNPNAGTSNSFMFFQFFNSSGVLLNLFKTGPTHATPNVCQVRRGTTVLAEFSLVSGVYYYIEVSVEFSTTVGSVIVRIDGVETVNLSNINTANVALGAGCTGLRFSGGSTAAFFSTDIYIRETPAEGNPFYGPIVMRLLRPDATISNDMTLVGATAHGALADATGTDYSTSYVETNTLGNAVEVGIEDLPAGVNSIIAVVPVAVSIAPNGGAPMIDLRTRVGSGGALSASNPAATGVSTYQTQTRAQLLAPDGTPWSIAKANDLRLRIEAA